MTMRKISESEALSLGIAIAAALLFLVMLYLVPLAARRNASERASLKPAG